MMQDKNDQVTVIQNPNQRAPQELKTRRLTILPFEDAFLTNDYVGWLNDAQVTRFSNQRFLKHTLESCRAYVDSFLDSEDMLWAIVRDEDKKHIGNIGAALERPYELADLSILIGEATAWGTGIGAEAWQAAIDYLFGVEKLRKITAGTLELNRGMLRVMQKCGMREEGRRVRHYIVDGQEVDMIYYGIFRGAATT